MSIRHPFGKNEGHKRYSGSFVCPVPTRNTGLLHSSVKGEVKLSNGTIKTTLSTYQRQYIDRRNGDRESVIDDWDRCSSSSIASSQQPCQNPMKEDVRFVQILRKFQDFTCEGPFRTKSILQVAECNKTSIKILK